MVSGLPASNSAENEWCAANGPAARRTTDATKPPKMYALMSILRLEFHGLRSVVLTNMNGQFLAGHPAKGPRRGPRFRVCAGVVNRQIVFQRVEIRPSEPLGQLELLGVRKTAVGKPEVLV